MSNETKVVAASIVVFLKQQLDGDTLSPESRESVEVGAQCIETAFELTPEDSAIALDLEALARKARASTLGPEHADRLKNEGNELMKAERHREALERYTQALDIDPRNAVYFCNRAAAHFKLGEHEAAVADCAAALALQPDYGKAHGRLGLALSALERHREARAAYARAVQLEPDNESYRQNLRLAEERLAQAGDRAPLDLGGLLQNPTLLDMASGMLSDPNMQNIITNLMEGVNSPVGAPLNPPGISALLQAGQALAQQMQSANPELVDQLRRQMRTTQQPGNDSPTPPGTQPPGNPPPS